MSLQILGATPRSLGSNVTVQSCKDMILIIDIQIYYRLRTMSENFLWVVSYNDKFWRYCCYLCWAYALI